MFYLQIVVLCSQWSKLLAKFVFKISTFRCNTCAYR